MKFKNFKIINFSYNKEENKFICEVTISSDDCKFVFLLIKDGKKVEEIRWTDSNKHTFNYYGDGVYYCQVEVKSKGHQNIMRRSKTIECFSDEYCHFLDTKFKSIPSQSYNCIFSLRDYPDDDFCIISAKEKLYSIEMDQLNAYQYHNSTIITNGKLYTHQGKVYIMSGSCVTDNHKYIRGGDDIIKHNINIEDIFHCLGKYSFALFESSKITLFNDYHGQNKLYYFSDKNLTVISNRLHLLILCLKKLKIHITLFDDKAIAFLTCRYHQLFTQNFCSEMLIKNIFQSYAGEIFSVENGELKISHDGIYNIISKKYNSTLSDKEYIEKLDNACEEIINNISAIVNSEHTQRVIIDVTGGMDSRIALAALTNIKTTRKIYYRISKAKKKEENEVALLLAGFYNYDFFDGTGVYRKHSEKDYLSFSMETKYLDRLDTEYTSKETILFNGFYGEASVRPRFSRDFYFNSPLEDITDPAEYIKLFFSYYVSPVMIVDYDRVGYKLYNIFRHEFLSIYGEDIPSKLENHYLNYSHAYHCAPSLCSSYILESYSPIKSKHLIELHRHNSLLWKDIKLGLDLTYKLNPMFSKIKYENDQYNNFYNNNFEKLIVSQNQVFANMTEIHAEDRHEEWERSLISQQKNILTQSYKRQEQISILNSIISMLNYCIEKKSIFTHLKYPLYHFIEVNEENKFELNILFNRLAVLTYFINLTNKE